MMKRTCPHCGKAIKVVFIFKQRQIPPPPGYVRVELRRWMNMKVRRKYNLSRIGKTYESVDIEVEGNDIEEIIERIEKAWRAYCKAVVEGRVQWSVRYVSGIFVQRMTILVFRSPFVQNVQTNFSHQTIRSLEFHMWVQNWGHL